MTAPSRSRRSSRRSAHTPAALGSKWIRPVTRWAIYIRDGLACVYCGAGGSKTRLSIDHVRSVEREGKRDNSARNLVTCCQRCNSSKKSISARAWYARLRARGFDTRKIQRRIARLVRKPLDRASAAALIAELRDPYGAMRAAPMEIAS